MFSKLFTAKTWYGGRSFSAPRAAATCAVVGVAGVALGAEAGHRGYSVSGYLARRDAEKQEALRQAQARLG
jgi:hypothetical protein